MDYPAEQNQYQQYYSQYQQQQAANDLSPSSSQVQSYDQSAEAYYAYNNQQYGYYPPQDYSNSYPQQTQHQYHQEPTSIHPSGVPVTPDPTHNTAAHEQTHMQNQHNAYYAQGAVENQMQQQANLGASAAVVALSQLTQFAGNMDAAQRGMHSQIVGQSAYRGGGRRGGVRKGGRPFQGGRRGPFGNCGTRPDGSAPYGKGRGHGDGRHLLPHGAASAPPNSVLAPAESASTSVPPSTSFPGQAPSPVPAAPSWPPPHMAWCELCRVDCNTPEILEQHKNGKRHKKNLQIQEEFKNLNKIVTGQKNVQMPNSVFKSEVVHPEKVEGSKEVKTQVDGSTSLAVNDDNRNETEQQNDPGEKSEVPVVNSVEPKRNSRDPFESWGIGPKRKMRGGRGGKYIRPNEGPRRPVEPPKPKEVIPFICELCNVKCESQVVFDSHLTGKKHLSNLKRFHGHQALYGEAGLQALYPPNFNAPSSSSIPQVQQGISDPQVLLAQLLNYVLSQAQAPGLVPPQVPGLVVPPAPPAPSPSPSALVSQPSLGAQCHHISQTPGSQTLSEAGSKTTTVEVENHCVSTNAQFEAPLPGNIDTKTWDGTLASKAKDVSQLEDNSNIVPSENAEVGLEQVLSATASDTLPESEAASLNQVVQRVPRNNMEDPESENGSFN